MKHLREQHSPAGDDDSSGRLRRIKDDMIGLSLSRNSIWQPKNPLPFPTTLASLRRLRKAATSPGNPSDAAAGFLRPRWRLLFSAEQHAMLSRGQSPSACETLANRSSYCILRRS